MKNLNGEVDEQWELALFSFFFFFEEILPRLIERYDGSKFHSSRKTRDRGSENESHRKFKLAQKYWAGLYRAI